MTANEHFPLRERVATALHVVDRRDRPPSSVVIIASTPRTGSTLLGRTLGATGLVGHPAEYLLPMVMAQRATRWGVPRVRAREMVRYRRQRQHGFWKDPEYSPFTARSTRQYLLVVGRREQSANGVFTLKTHHASFDRSMLRNGLGPDVWGAPVTWLRTHRRDHLAQAVSLVRAEQTGQFVHDFPLRGETRYDRDAIRSAIDRMERQESGWDQYFTAQGIEPFVVVYEDLVADHVGVMRTVLDHLGHPDIDVPPPAIERQGDGLNAEWIERFRRETGAG